MNIGFYSYLGAATVYGFFALLLFFNWRKSQQGRYFAGMIVISAIWSGLAIAIVREQTQLTWIYQVFEIVRYMAWYLFLLNLFNQTDSRMIGYKRFRRWAKSASIGFAGLVLILELGWITDKTVLVMSSHVCLAIIGLAILEQLYRNTAVRHRWAIKFLFIGAGALFAFDFYMYVDATLFYALDRQLWEIRGIVNMIAVPMLAVSAVRNKNWALKVFVSRDIVFTSFSIMAGALYLFIMAAAGYYIREFGGDWGQITQVIFISLAVAFLLAALSSSRLRARARVFVGKHFFANKYDYRREWLQLTDQLSSQGEGRERFNTVMQVLARIVDARSGLLWTVDDHHQFRNTGAWQTDWIEAVMPNDDSLVQFLEETGYVINLTELELNAHEYEKLELPVWLADVDRPWLIVPLFGLKSMIGFVVLARPLIMRSINWEDRDLLKAAAKQVGSYLTVLQTSEALAEAKQFELFNRLSSYMVHDLKNISAELELVARNAELYKGDAEFIDDAFEAVDNAASNINRLLDQLRKKRIQEDKATLIDLDQLVKEVINSKSNQQPVPVFQSTTEKFYVIAESSRLRNVVAHLIDNAQQATEADGSIIVTLTRQNSLHQLSITDSGHGMTADFIQNRLFKPFDTTKGNAGMGIGMYEGREFIRHLGGDIDVDSKPGKGSTIALNFPASSKFDIPETAFEG